MPPFSHHIFICCNQRSPDHPRGCCDPDGSESLRAAFRACLRKKNLGRSRIRANKAGCLEQCEYGPTVAIYPQGIFYGGVAPEDVPRIVEETIIGGRILHDLRISDEMLNNATPENVEAWKRSRRRPPSQPPPTDSHG